MPNLNTARFSLTGMGEERALGDRLEDRWITVKDFGAVGDGSANDTAAIQATFDYAYGPASDPHGRDDAHLNKAVFFPRGIYKISAPIKLNRVDGANLIGAGSHQSRIVWSGAAVEGSDTGIGVYPVIECRGCWYTHMEGLTFDASGIQNVVMYSTGFPDWIDDGSDGYYRDIHVTGPVVINDAASDYAGGIGVLMGSPLQAMASERTWVKCKFTNCEIQGYRPAHDNALNHEFYGCTFADNRWGIFGGGAAGSVVVKGCRFENNSDMDIHLKGGVTLIEDCYSTSLNFASIDGCITGCTHINGSEGEFYAAWNDVTRYYPPDEPTFYTVFTDAKTALLTGNHSTNGTVVTDGVSSVGVQIAGAHLMGNRFDNSDYLDDALAFGTPPSLVVDGTRLSPP